MAFAESSDMAYTLKQDMEANLKTHITLLKVIDSQFLFDVLTKATVLRRRTL